MQWNFKLSITWMLNLTRKRMLIDKVLTQSKTTKNLKCQIVGNKTYRNFPKTASRITGAELLTHKMPLGNNNSIWIISSKRTLLNKLHNINIRDQKYHLRICRLFRMKVRKQALGTLRSILELILQLLIINRISCTKVHNWWVLNKLNKLSMEMVH